ncbi:MAG TPA: hypothetical protein VD994_18700, partial [Prosthecobacter sp.]|nr:hypothetical protein [Prosthecobacter sp.]
MPATASSLLTTHQPTPRLHGTFPSFSGYVGAKAACVPTVWESVSMPPSVAGTFQFHHPLVCIGP